MLFKILLLAALGYFFVRLVYKPAELKDNRREQIRPDHQTNQDDEYVDYEEVE